MDDRSHDQQSNPTGSQSQPSNEQRESQGSKLDQQKREAKQSKDDATAHLGQRMDQAGQKLHDSRDRLRRQASETRQKASEKTEQASEYVRDQTRSFVQSRKQRVSGYCNDVASAMDAAAQTLREREDATMASAAESACGGVRSTAQYLEQNEPEELLEDARALTRKYPEFVFGGMFLVGLAAARFLKSTEDRGGHDADAKNAGRGSAQGRGESADGEKVGSPTIYPQPQRFEKSHGTDPSTPKPEHAFAESSS